MVLLTALLCCSSAQRTASRPRIAFWGLVEGSDLIVTGRVYETRVGSGGSLVGEAKLEISSTWKPAESPAKTITIVWDGGSGEGAVDSLGPWLLFLKKTESGTYRPILGAAGTAPISRCWDADPAISAEADLHECLLGSPELAWISMPRSLYRRVFVRLAGREPPRVDVASNGVLLKDLKSWIEEALADDDSLLGEEHHLEARTSEPGAAPESPAPVECELLAAEHDLGWPALQESCTAERRETRLYLMGREDAGLALRWIDTGAVPSAEAWRLRFLNPDRRAPSGQEPGITCGGFVFAYDVERIAEPVPDEESLGERVRAIAARRQIGSGLEFEDAALMVAEACRAGSYERSTASTAGRDTASEELRSLRQRLAPLFERPSQAERAR